MFKIKSELWLNIQLMDDKTQEVKSEVTIPLVAFDQIIVSRDSLIRAATEMVIEEPVPTGSAG
jgi:hypothetical protein